MKFNLHFILRVDFSILSQWWEILSFSMFNLSEILVFSLFVIAITEDLKILISCVKVLIENEV